MPAPLVPLFGMAGAEADSLVLKYVQHRVTMGDFSLSTAAQRRDVLRAWHRVAGPDHRAWTEEQAARWVNDPQVRPATRKGRLGALRPYVRWLVAAGELDVDVTANVARVVLPPQAPRDFTPVEVDLILAQAGDERDELVVRLMSRLGLRCGDVARIRVEDVDPRRRVLAVRGKGGRGEVTHEVPIPSDLWAWLERRLRRLRRSSGPLIWSRTTGDALRPASVGDLVARMIEDAGLKMYPGDGRTPHALRHTCATLLAEAADNNLRIVQRVLGHRSVRTTELYVRREPAGLREALEGAA